jgi:hypothetical protein
VRVLLWLIGVEIGSLGVSGCDICESRLVSSEYVFGR